MDNINVYHQSLINLEKTLKSYLDEKTFSVWVKDDVKKLEELFIELERIPKEVDFNSSNDINLLRAFIKEELNRNEQAKQMVETSIDVLRENLKCPKTNKCMHNDNLNNTNACNLCWTLYLKNRIEREDLPF